VNATQLLDRLGRPLRNLRLSVTDRCNLRCSYCMPEADYVWLPRADVLTLEEMDRLVDAFVSLGVDTVRLTGGEPLLRRDVGVLVAALARKPGVRDLAMTTNGVLLADHAHALKQAGLRRLTISIDTLDPARFRALSRRDDHARVLAGIAAASAVGFAGTKLDTVLIRGVNDDEIESLLDYARDVGAELRFIEYMDVGGATHWEPGKVVARSEILARVARRHGTLTPVDGRGSAPAERFRLDDGTTFGIVASTTTPFCRSCDRSRLTADGTWYLCLYAKHGLDLRTPLRAGATAEQLAALLADTWRHRRDRGAEERVALADRRPLVASPELRADPRLEMHTRGG
jgi:cyclic pyranopterin phosphate synthase